MTHSLFHSMINALGAIFESILIKDSQPAVPDKSGKPTQNHGEHKKRGLRQPLPAIRCAFAQGQEQPSPADQSSGRSQFPQLEYQRRKDLSQVTDYAHIGRLENGRQGILIHGEDELRPLKPGGEVHGPGSSQTN